MKTNESHRSRRGLVMIGASVALLVVCGVAVASLAGSDLGAPPHRYSGVQSEARRLLEEGKTSEARKIFEEELRKDSKSIEAVWGLALCARDDGDDESALAFFHQLTKLAPKDRSAWRNLALCASRLGRDMEALSAAQTALSLAPEGDKGMSELVSRLITKKSMLEGGMAGDQLPGEALPGQGRKGAGIDPLNGVRPLEPPDPRRNLPVQGRDR